MLNEQLDLNKFRMLDDVDKTQSLARSSLNLNLTSSAIHQGIKKLESELGFNLFHRTGKKYISTDKAIVLLESYRKFLNEISVEQVSSADSKNNSQMSGEIKIAMPLNFSKTIFSKVISKFLRHYPNILINIVVAETHQSINHILNFGVDIAITDNDIPDNVHKRISSSVIHEEELGLVCSAKFYQENLERLSDNKKMLDLPHFSYSKDLIIINEWYQIMANKRKKQKFKKVHTVDNVETLLSLINQDIGLGVVPISLVEKDINKNKIKLIKFDDDKKVLNHLYLVQNLDYVLTPKLRVFIDFLIQELMQA